MKFEPNFHRQWNFWILPDFKCLQVREVQESEIRGEFSSREHFQNFARFRGQKCEICAKFSSAVEFLDFAGYQVITAPGGARMRNSSRIFIASPFSGFFPILGAKMWNLRKIFIGSGISGFCRISSVCRSGRCKNVKSIRIFIARSFSRFYPILGAKIWNLSQIFIISGISGFWWISSVYSSGRCKNAKFEPNFHRECIFLILPNFGGKNVKFEPNFHRQWNFWILPDFKCLHVREVQECEIRAEFSSRVHFLDFAQFYGQKC